ncbi:MAG TPA: hypothetical protein VHH92_03270 [Actinomycetota bacterium]|nr:hypothetical protein [Actinomycetota bacterium]
MRGRLVVFVALAALAIPVHPATPGPGSPELGPYRGLGTWVDLFEERAWRRPGAAVADMANHGVRTLYLETSNYSQRRGIVDAAAVGRFVEAAHARGIEVVAWYLPGFDRLRRDLRRSMRAISFRTPSGQAFDSFALDIEASIVDPPKKRTRRLLTLSRRIRARVGPDYALGAIIPSPYRMQRGKTWPGFPYAQLADIYDVFLPMSYYTFHVGGEAPAHDEVAASIPIIRSKTGDPSVPIHVIGGIADASSGAETRGFVRAAREHGVLGASLYNWSLTRVHDWTELRPVPANVRQTPPLPLGLPSTDELGYLPGGDRTHPEEVFFTTGPSPGDRTLTFESFGAAVDVMVNWQVVATTTHVPAWTPATVVVPDALLRDSRANVVGFVSPFDHPDWAEWGVRAVSLA